MWWTQRRQPNAAFLLPKNILDVVARAYAIVEVGGLDARGPKRGRDFEQLFYKVCDRREVHLTERAGARTIATQKSASGFCHEIDAASRAASVTTCWELKHLSTPLEKNELLTFNAKGMDYLYDSGSLFRRIPLYRFLLSGRNICDDCRAYGVQWGIMIVEPGRLVMPLIYEAMVRGLAPSLSKTDQDAVHHLAPWACRSLQHVVSDLAARCVQDVSLTPPSISRYAKEIIDMQEQIGRDVLDCIEEQYPDWVNELAQEVWHEVGGWA